MAWTYLRFDGEGDLENGEKEKLPPPDTVFLVFDALRWRVLVCWFEDGHYLNVIDHKLTDDCNVVAFANLSETEDPDLDTIRESSEWMTDEYSGAAGYIGSGAVPLR